MVIRGIQIRFSCANGEQFEEIGTFWDRMRALCPKTDLLGVGFGWENDTLCYLIGTENGVPTDAAVLQGRFPQAINAEVLLPDAGWKEYTATADTLDVLYADIYKDGPLDYETERFDEHGGAVIRVYREK